MRRDKILAVDIYSGKEQIIDLAQSCGIIASDIQITGFSEIDENQIWACTISQGFFKVNLAKEKSVHYKSNPLDKNSIPSNNISIILNDKSLVWLVSQGVGLIKFEFLNPVFKTYRSEQNNDKMNLSLDNNIRTIFEEDENSLLLGSLSGVTRFDLRSRKFSEYHAPGQLVPFLKNYAISKILRDFNGNIWVSIWGKEGIAVISKDGKRMINLNPAKDPKKPEFNSLRCMFLDAQGTLWIGSDNNAIYSADISKLDFDNPLSVKFNKVYASKNSKDSLNFTICFSINQSKNGPILIATQNGFFTLDKRNNYVKRYVHNESQKSSISYNDVRAIFIDRRNQIWLATNGGGLNLFDEKSQVFTHFIFEDGLPDNSVYSIAQDRSGKLWLGTNKGLCAFDYPTKSSRNFLLKDGIQNYEFNTNAALLMHNGMLVFGGINGINLFDPDSIHLDKTPPKLVITEFKVLDADYPMYDHEIKLEHNQNYISFEFAALNYFRNSENNYAYKLEGLDKDWIYCSDRRFTNYPNLDPGKYLFKVKVSNSFGIWNEGETSIQFTIATPWYNTWIFYILLLLSGSAIVYTIYKYRLQQAIEMQNIRNNIARDLHDEIGSNLSSISLFTQVAKDNDQSEGLSPLLQKIGEYTQTSQEAMNDIVWMVNTKNDRFENIIVKMRTLAVELLEAKNISLFLQFDERLNQIKLGMNERKNFYLIYKEALNNIVKYAGCTNVTIKLVPEQGKVVLAISDDGKGFNEAAATGNGLENMKKRAQVLKGEISIVSAPGKGTELILTFGV